MVADKGGEQGGCVCGAKSAAELLGGVIGGVCWVKNGGCNQGGQVCRLGGGGYGWSYMFRISKWKHVFMKMNMTGDVYTLRR